MGKKMKPSLLLESPLELGLRVSIIMAAYHPHFLSQNELLFLDYIMVHCNDFYNDFTSVYPASNFRTSDISERKSNLSKALHLYTRKGIIVTKLTSKGTVYRVGGNYPAFINSLDNDFVRTLTTVAKTIFMQEHGKTLDELYLMWRNSVEHTRNQIDIPLLEEVIYE